MDNDDVLDPIPGGLWDDTDAANERDADDGEAVPENWPTTLLSVVEDAETRFPLSVSEAGAENVKPEAELFDEPPRSRDVLVRLDAKDLEELSTADI